MKGGEEEFSLFQDNGQLGLDFKAVYNFHMRIEALYKALKFYEMTDVFNIILTKTITILEAKLHNIFVRNDILDQYINKLEDNPDNLVLLSNKTAAKVLFKKAIEDIDAIEINPISFIKHIKEVDITSIRLSNVYYAKYGNIYSVEKLRMVGRSNYRYVQWRVAQQSLQRVSWRVQFRGRWASYI